MRTFDVPKYFRSRLISSVKAYRKKHDPLKKDFSPTILDFGPIQIVLARHFGFCFGVENAIEIAYNTLSENRDTNVYMLSEMIHNQEVNNDLKLQGLRFIQDTKGNALIDWSELREDDIVMIPAFGTTLEIEEKLKELKVQTKEYNTTCPFVVKVWKSAAKLGSKSYSVVLHGKPEHEETRATFSHSKSDAPTVIVRNMDEAELLISIIKGDIDTEAFFEIFEGRFSSGFDPEKDLDRVGVVNQTTMLASETQAIAERFKENYIEMYGDEYTEHYADTRDTLCYATNDNQKATLQLLNSNSDLAIVVGGYNSSNTSHLVELCERQMPTYFIKSADKILDQNTIEFFDLHDKVERRKEAFLPNKQPAKVIITSGASCPDALLDDVLDKLLSYYPSAKSIEEVGAKFQLSD